VVYPQYWPAFALVLCFLLGLIVVSQIRPAALWILDLCGKLPLVKGFIAPLRDFYEGSYSLFKPVPMLVAVGLGMVSWLGEGIGFYFILTGLGLTPDIKLLGLAIFILSFSTVVGAVSALPGGLGAAEVSIAGMLTLLDGTNPAISTSATLLIRLATLWFGVLLGLIVWSFSLDLLGLRNKHAKDIQG
jgi:glycosyltransferase 2 family protein